MVRAQLVFYKLNTFTVYRKTLILLPSVNHDYTKYVIGNIITHEISNSSDILPAINSVSLSLILGSFIHHFLFKLNAYWSLPYIS